MGYFTVPMAVLTFVWGVLAGAGANINQYWLATAAPKAPDFANGLFLASTNLGTTVGTSVCGYFLSSGRICCSERCSCEYGSRALPSGIRCRSLIWVYRRPGTGKIRAQQSLRWPGGLLSYIWPAERITGKRRCEDHRKSWFSYIERRVWKMKKIISILFIALWVFTVTLAGCGHNGEDTAGSGTDIWWLSGTGRRWLRRRYMWIRDSCPCEKFSDMIIFLRTEESE